MSFDDYDSFGSTVAATEGKTLSGTHPVDWFWYRQFRNQPCATVFEGGMCANQCTTLADIQVTGVSSTVFPSIRTFQYHGMGDYVGILKRGLPQGILYPTWVESVPMTTGTCVPCLGAQYSTAIMATRIHLP